MATHLPAKLKTADIQRFALRASQLETAKPAIAYWCEYWIVNQLLARALHNSDAECLQYTTTMMDKLEQTKTRYATDDAIIDDAAGQAYVEQFGLETFERADRAIKANKVTKQTADTFLASATFLELLNIWGEPSSDIHAKIRYAKWNAVRIAKALKEGKDPNESNPKPEPVIEEENLQPLDPNDPEVQQLTGETTNQRQASVEDVPDEQDRIESRLAAQSFTDQSLHPSAQPSARASPGHIDKFDPYPRSGFPHSVARENDVSPLDPADAIDPKYQTRNDREGSVGGGYFPEVPSFTSDARSATLPTAPPDNLSSQISPPDLPYTSHFQSGSSAARDFDSIPPTMPDQPSAPPQNFYTPPPQQHFPRQAPAPTYTPPSAPAPAPAPVQPKEQGFIPDDAAMAKAQKHARFAISALTFDDANTAIKELRAALQTLGAQ